jgi:hypothetical protein
MAQFKEATFIQLNPGLVFYKDRGLANVDEKFQEIVADVSEVIKSIEYLMSSKDLDSFGESGLSESWRFHSRKSG